MAIVAGTVLVAAVVANALAKAIESIYMRRPDIIKARGEARAAGIAAQSEAKVRVIEAESEAYALKLRVITRAELLRAGICPDKTEQVAEMLRHQSVDATLPKGRRLDNRTLANLLAPVEVGSTDAEPDVEPKGVHRKVEDESGRVVLIRQDEKSQ